MGSIEFIYQLILDRPRETTCEPPSETGERCLTAQECVPVHLTSTRIITGEKQSSNLHRFCPKGNRRYDASCTRNSPAAIIGRFTASDICGIRDIVPIRESSAFRINDPRCPPASKPDATMMSTPASARTLASFTVVAVPINTMPSRLHSSSTYFGGTP